MRAMRAQAFRGYEDLKLADIPKPAVSEGRVLVKITAAGVTAAVAVGAGAVGDGAAGVCSGFAPA